MYEILHLVLQIYFSVISTIGFNEKKFSNQWGGEDWELVDRIVATGLYVFHDRMPRFYHVYHNNKNTWDGTHI